MAHSKERGLVAEFLGFLWTNKLWWLIPLVLVVAFVVLLALSGEQSSSPFIYNLFG